MNIAAIRELGSLGFDAVFSELAAVLDAVGSSQFYDLLSRFLARATGSDHRLVIRYSAYDRPAFLLNNFMSPEAVALYLSGLYTIDPLHARVRQSRVPEVAHLRSPTHDLPLDDRYLPEIFKIAFIFDELAFLLPALGGVTIGICCDKRHQPFGEEEACNASALLPLVASIHRRHLDQVFVNALRLPPGGGHASAIDTPVLILDRSGEAVYASPAWEAEVAANSSLEAEIRRARNAGLEILPLVGGRVAHWEALDEAFPVAPSGAFVSIEARPTLPSVRFGAEAVDDFCVRHALTPREADVVRLILTGYPNHLIAERLNLSLGTVKNHRWRLYYKLDITTERELFVLFLSGLISG